MHHRADINEFLSAFSGTLTTSCIQNSNAMNDVLYLFRSLVLVSVKYSLLR